MTDRLRAVPQTAKTPSSEAPTSAARGVRKSFNTKYLQASRWTPLLQEERGTAIASACPISSSTYLRPTPVSAPAATLLHTDNSGVHFTRERARRGAHAGGTRGASVSGQGGVA